VICLALVVTGATSDGAAARRYRVTTRGMSYGPHAVADLNGKVLFVRGAAPAEEVEVSIREERRNFAYAEVVSVLRPSGVRRQPPCLYLPRCGGCPWQHLDYAAQLAAKETIVREQLRRLAGIEASLAPIIASPREYGYRQRLKLRVQAGAVGFHAAASHTLVSLDHCLLAAPEIDAAIAWTTELVRTLRTRVRRAELIASGMDDGRVVLVGEAEGQWVAADERSCHDWLNRHEPVGGLLLHGRRWRRVWGDDRVTVFPEVDLPLALRAGTFMQVNPEANRLLVATVVGLVGPPSGQRVLDFYAGAGNFALPLARRGATVVAVEQQPWAAADGAANARRLGIRDCRFLNARVEQALDSLLASNARFSVAILDPPRSGAAAVVDPLLRLAPARIIYVSCDPATLARDLRQLACRYRIGVIQPIDLFPHTYHVETVVECRLER